LKNSSQNTSDFLDVLARDARTTVDKGYYDTTTSIRKAQLSLKTAITENRNAPIIAEIKAASPSLGTIREGVDVKKTALAMKRGGATGISVLTMREHFTGSLDALREARRHVSIPLLMKDIVISRRQIDAASKIGASAVLLIKALSDRGYCECDMDEMIAYAKSRGLEVLLETHTEDEFSAALETDADLIGINNRDLRTLKVDINVTCEILRRIDPAENVVVSESGVNNPEDIRLLHEAGADAFLVGSAIMKSKNVEEKVTELVKAI
jgi:indole-3-glycerol phosphate synthase